ncbi:uncharacterized protein LOC135627113 [Musa acuminata AAA Group]|uniref:uncharacterized protein LOC135627113 n=1 Tax=Musa acuminata AAA Group TaxID=214697 RepID=UPI0031DB57B8
MRSVGSSREMVNLRALCGGKASSSPSTRSPTEARVGSREVPVDIEAGRPRKRTKTSATKAFKAAATQAAGAVAVPAGRVGRSLRRGEAGTSREAAGKAPREPSIRDLCHLSAGGEDEPYQTRVMGDLPQGQAFDPLVGCWEGFTRGSRVWADGDSVAWFVRGGLHPDIARDLYTLPSKTLLGKSAKSLLWGNHYAAALMDRVRDAGRVIGILSDRNAELRKQIEEVHAGAAPEAVAVAE